MCNEEVGKRGRLRNSSIAVVKKVFKCSYFTVPRAVMN